MRFSLLVLLFPIFAFASSSTDDFWVSDTLFVGDSNGLDLLQANHNGLSFPEFSTVGRNSIGSTNNGQTIFNDTTLSLDYYDSSAWRRLFTDTPANTTTPSSPSSGYVKVYAKSDQLAFVNSSGQESLLAHGSTTLSSSGSFTAPAGVTQVKIYGCGGGGGGGGGGAGNTGGAAGTGGSGGNGALSTPMIYAVTGGSSYSVVIGAGGVGGNGGTAAGNGVIGSPGTASTFDNLSFPGAGAGGAGHNGGSSVASVAVSTIENQGQTGGAESLTGTTPMANIGYLIGTSGVAGSSSGGFGGGGGGGGGAGLFGAGGTGNAGGAAGNHNGTAASAATANTCSGGGGGGGGGASGGGSGVGGKGGTGGSGQIIVTW